MVFGSKQKIVILGVIIGALLVAGIPYGIFYLSRFPEKGPQEENIPVLAEEKENIPTLKEKVGQMLMIGFRGTEAPRGSYISKVVGELGVGGVVLFDYDVPSKSFPRNIINPQQTEKLISELQLHAAKPLLIAVDAEGGNVNRLQEKYGFSNILSAKEMGTDATASTTKRESERLAKELKELGFNMNLAPVVDVNINSKNPIIGALGRSFSSDPKEVTDNARVFIENQLKNNIVTVVKHFPGHGSSTGDSHLGIVDITNTYKKEELDPYIELQKEGLLDVVMTAHTINRNVDEEYPVTFSARFLQEILRKEVGFAGIIMSDDMKMSAIADNYEFKEAIIKTVNAGYDILLLPNNGTGNYDEQLPYKAIDIIYDAVKEGKISERRIEESYHRIYKLKRKFGILE